MAREYIERPDVQFQKFFEKIKPLFLKRDQIGNMVAFRCYFIR